MLIAMLKNKHPRLEALVCAAGLDTTVRRRLLNGQRRKVAAEFDLSGQELEAVMAISATTHRGFAQGLREWVGGQESSTFR
jgi:hypothetical protein